MYRLLQKLPVNDATTCLGNLLTHTVVEIDRYINSRRKSVYLLAALVRNVFEICLIVEYILRSRDNLRDWIGQRVSDEIGILNSARLLSVVPNDTDWIDAEIQKLKARAAKQDIQESRYRLPSYYSKHLGRGSEYEKFYGLFSKFIHPSSWVINEDKKRIETADVFQTIFARKTKQYLDEILGHVATYISSRIAT
jgi:hypothetical protein